MNYNRIYEELIADRLANPPQGYAEVHHIAPRCMGGSDDDANLIRLTPEDHFFAHLLLAKAHGGWKLVGAAKLMADKAGGKDSSLTRVRKMYGYAKRLRATEIRGRGHPNYDHRIFHFRHEDGSERKCTKHDLCLEFGVDIRILTSVVSGSRKTTRGWAMASRTEEPGFFRGKRTGVNHSGADKTIRRWRHRNGAEFEGTNIEFAKQQGWQTTLLLRYVIDGKLLQTKGWYLTSQRDAFPCPFVAIDARSPPLTLKHYDGRVVTGPRSKITRELGLICGEVTTVISGKTLNTKGWMLPDTDPQTINLGGVPPRSAKKPANDNTKLLSTAVAA